MTNFQIEGTVSKIGRLQKIQNGFQLKVTIKKKIWDKTRTNFKWAQRTLTFWDSLAQTAYHKITTGSIIQATGHLVQRTLENGIPVTWRNVRGFAFKYQVPLQMELPF